MRSFQPSYLLWHQSATVLSSVFGLSSAVRSWLAPEDSYLLDILRWYLKCNFFLFLCCSLDIYRFSVCFHFTSILELFWDICFLRNAFKCFSTWWLVLMNQYILVVLSITKHIFPLYSEMQSFLLISRHKKIHVSYVVYMQPRYSSLASIWYINSVWYSRSNKVMVLELSFSHAAAHRSSLSVF